MTTPSKIEEYSIERLLRVGEAEDSYIVKHLLRKGDQMLLAGPPKTGKSYLASELALALSLPFSEEEKERTLWCASVPKPATEPEQPKSRRFVINPKPEPRDKVPGARGWNVLVFTLEMNVSEVARRLIHQAGKYVIGVKRLEKDMPLDGLLKEAELTHIFALPGKNGEQVQDLSILDATVARFGSPPEFMPGPHSVGLKKAIQEHKPDVIIYDSLIQLHNLAENDNIQMKAVMRELRRISSYQKEGRTESVAHIILHHTRKPSAKEGRDPSAAMMRGAGSIHAAADLVMTINKDSSDSAPVRVAFSARSAHPPEGMFEFEPETHTHVWVPVAKNKVSGKKPAMDQRKEGYLKILENKAGAEWQEVTKSWIKRLPTTPATVKGHLETVSQSLPGGLELTDKNPGPNEKRVKEGYGYWVRRVAPKNTPDAEPTAS